MLARRGVVEQRHVGAGAERPTEGGHNDGADVAVALGPVEGIEVRVLELLREAVHAIGAVEGDDSDAIVADLVENRFFVSHEG